MISLETFEELSTQYTVIPIVRHLLSDVMTPVSAYLSMRSTGVPSFLFESVEPNEKIGRYSFIGTSPVMLITAKENNISVSQGGTKKEFQGNIFDVLQQYSSQYHVAPMAEVSGLSGGFVGYIGYGCVRSLEQIPACPEKTLEPDSMVGLFATIIRFDHHRQMAAIIHNAIIEKGSDASTQFRDAVKTIEAVELQLKRPPVIAHSFSSRPAISSDSDDRPMFQTNVEKAKEHIHEGDIFQVVLSRRVSVPYSGDSFAVYRALRVINPSPYLFFIDFGAVRLIGSSPEVLVKVQSNTVTVLPIAGTRPRGATVDEDAALEKDLIHDKKELAEHLMLVDLGRNDVGSVSKPGSVRVPRYAAIERFSHVMHIVSEVQGELESGKTGVDALKRSFPAGTVSGAPKVRAMEIIAQLERRERGAYGGAVGYVGFDGTVDTCIAIRTIVDCDGVLSIQAGAGIVADSKADAEFDETENKARALLSAIRLASNSFALPGKE